MKTTLIRLGALVAVLAIWQLLALRGLPDFVLSPVDITKHFAAARPKLFSCATATM